MIGRIKSTAALAVCACLLVLAAQPSRADTQYQVVGIITVRDMVGNELFNFDCKAAFTIVGVTVDQRRHRGTIDSCAYDVAWPVVDQGSNAITLWFFITPQYAQCTLLRARFDRGNGIDGRLSVKLHNDATVWVRCPQPGAETT